MIALTIWLALACYVVSARLQWRDSPHVALSRWAWTLGALAMLFHALAAFHLRYEWSHEEAVRQTAERCEQTVGVAVGQGVWFNYAMVAIWLVDAGRWWWTRDRECEVARRAVWLHVFFLFMIVNGAVVFAPGWSRWAGAALLCLLWLGRPRAAA